MAGGLALQLLDVNIISPPKPPGPSTIKKKPGPKPKALSKRAYQTPKAITRVERSYSQGKKIQVLMFLHHYWIVIDTTEKAFQHPSYAEAEAFFKIPSSTICDWNRPNKVEMLISQGRGGCGGSHTVLHHWWPKLEEKLFAMFLERRGEGRVVRRGWFRRQATRSFQQLNPNTTHLF